MADDLQRKKSVNHWYTQHSLSSDLIFFLVSYPSDSGNLFDMLSDPNPCTWPLRYIFAWSLLFLFYFSLNEAHSQPVETRWQRFDYGTHIGTSNLLVEDIDRDGIQEIILGAGGLQNTFVTVLEAQGDEYGPRWVSRRYDGNPVRSVEVANVDLDGDYEIYVLLEDGQIEVYDGFSQSLTAILQTDAAAAIATRIADVDNDGRFEYTVLGENYLHIYNTETFFQEWDTTAFSNSVDFQVGDVDQDGNNEIVLSEGLVLDGTSKQTKWRHSEAFGDQVVLGDVDKDGVVEIVGMERWNFITAFDGMLQDQIWQINTNSDQATIQIDDTDGDGTAEILLGTAQWGLIQGYSTDTQELLWEIENPQHGVTNLAVGDVDGDGSVEAVWGTGHTSTGADLLVVGSIEYEQVEWQSSNLATPYHIAAGDINSDGTVDVIGVAKDDFAGTTKLLYFDEKAQELDLNDLDVPSMISGVRASDINGDGNEELLVSSANQLLLLDTATYQTIREATIGSTDISAFAVEDLDNDGQQEIIIGNLNGDLHLVSSDTFSEVWSISAPGGLVGGIKLINIDDDEALEIIVFNAYDPVAAGGTENWVRIYDGFTRELQWETDAYSDITALEVADLDRDKSREIIIGRNSGEVSLVDSRTYEGINTFQAASSPISSLCVDNIDQSPLPELLVGANTLKVFRSTDFVELWEVDDIGNRVGASNNLQVMDPDQDLMMDIFFTSSAGLFYLETTTPFLDITPPQVLNYLPLETLSGVGIDANIIVRFTEPLASETINASTVQLSTSDETIIPFTIRYESDLNEIVLSPESSLPENEAITVLLSGAMTDAAGNGLDGDQDGYADGASTDAFQWTFMTGEGTDTTGPRITEVSALEETIWAGIDLVVQVQATDSSVGAISSLTDIEAFIDEVGVFGEGIALEPLDFAFDAVEEVAQVNIKTDSLSNGAHTLFVHARDANGNWGDFQELRFFVFGEGFTSWTMHGKNAQHTGFNETETIEFPLQEIWSEQVASTGLNPAAVVNDRVLVSNVAGTEEGVLVTYDTESGSELWRYSFGEVYSVNPPSFGYGYVFVQSNNNEPGSFVTALDLDNGSVAWQSPYKTQWYRYLAPTVADGQVFVAGGRGGGMYAFDAFSGRELWFKQLPQYDGWTPAVYDGIVYGYAGGTLAAVHAKTGITFWEKNDIDINSDIIESATVIDHVNGILLTSSGVDVHAIDFMSRETLWSLEGLFSGSPVISNGVMYIIQSNVLVAYDIQTGQGNMAI